MSGGQFIFMVLARLNPTPLVIGWLETRPWRLLMAGIPVVAAIGGAVALRASMREANTDSLMRHYLAAGDACLKSGDAKGAELRYRRAELLLPTDQRPRYGLALVAEKRGDADKATSMMERIADERGEMSGLANRWLLANMPRENLDLAARQRLIDRLERAVAFEPANAQARLVLAEEYLKAGLRNEALPHLREAAATFPIVRIQMIRLLRSLGRDDEAQIAAVETERLMRERLRTTARDVDARIICALALSHQKRFDEAVRILEEGLALSEPVAIRRTTSAIFVAWATQLQEDNGDPRRILQLTAAALQSDPSNLGALKLMMDLSRDAATGDEALAALKGRLAAGESPWLVHLILGTRMLEIGDTAAGAEHLEQAVRLNPSAAVALNNLAWTLASREPADLKRAEELADQALKLAPANVQIRETRGQIYLKQGRWKEALGDLEAVLPVYSREKILAGQLVKVHESLARAYGELGNDEMARRHRELAMPN
jgi:tetratricopeptide (TPR) repeat protein